MAETISALNRFSSIWAQAMGAVLWQSVLLAAIAAAILWAWRRLPPAGRCWVWRIVAIKILLLPFWSASVPLPKWLALYRPEPVGVASSDVTTATTETHVATSAIPEEVAGAVNASPDVPVAAASIANVPTLSWQAWLLCVWLAVISAQVVRLAMQRSRLRRLLQSSRPAADGLQSMVADGCHRLGITQSAETRMTDIDVSPFVCRMVRPLVVLPASTLAMGDGPQLRQILLHELAHVRRRDLAWCWLTHAMRMVLWFHPVAHWVSFREALERELACDALAMAHSGTTAADYAQTLVDAAARISQPLGFRTFGPTKHSRAAG